MRILCLTTSFPRSAGDLSGVFVFHSMRTLVEQEKATVTVLAPAAPGYPFYEIMAGIKVYRFPYFFPLRFQKLTYQFAGLPTMVKTSLLAKLNLPFFLLAFLLWGCVLGRKADVIHAQWIPTGFIGLILKKIFRKSLVITARGADMRLAAKMGVGARVSRFICHHADAVFSVNESFGDFLPGKISYLPNGVMQAWFKPIPRSECVLTVRHTCGDALKHFTFSESIKTFLAIGHLSPIKGFDILIEAFANLIVKTDQKLQLVIIGEGQDEASIRHLISEKNLAPQILLLPFQPQHHLPYWYNLCEALIIPSRQEGRPNVLLEALACQKPILSTRLPGVLEVMPESYAALTCEPENAQALTDLLLAYIKNPKPFLEIALQGPRLLQDKHLTWEAHAKNLMGTYRRLL